MIMPKQTKPVPFDIKEVTDVIFGIHSEDEYSTFMRSRDIRRKAMDEELKNVGGVPRDCKSFDNLRKIHF